MSVARASHRMTLLADARVLVAGGVDNPNYSNVTHSSAELYDPATGMWSTTGSMTVARSHHTATRLGDGRVLVVSGATAERYNPATGTWITTGNLGTARALHTTIASSAPNSGSFQWAVTGPASIQALIRVSSVNQPAVQDSSNSTFRIRR